jgi:integrase/recombinase XerD
LNFNDIEGEHYGAWPLGHDKLETTARYTRVATGMIANVTSPLDLLSQPAKKARKRKAPPPA